MTSEVKTCIEIVSPEFPCGSAWLANCLLELGVPLWHLWGFDTREEWTRIEGNLYRYAALHRPWRQTLASLQPGREFAFIDNLAVRFSHEWPWHVIAGQRVVLVVRDPRDALYSEWQRHRNNLQLSARVSFSEFLQSPFFGGPISFVDMLWLYLRSWIVFRAALPQRVHVLRFEDWKTRPVVELRKVAAWIGIEASDETLRAASDASDVRHLQKLENAVVEEDPAAPRYNRRGEPYEWRTVWQPTWFTSLGKHWQPVLKALGYAPLDVPGEARAAIDMGRVLDWRGLDDPIRNRIWQDLISSDHEYCTPQYNRHDE